MVDALHESISRHEGELGKLSDAELVVRCQRELPKELGSYREILRRYEGLVFNTCNKLLGSRADAEEVTQDALIQVFQKIHQFEGRAAFRTWLYKIVHNYCRNRLSKMIRKREGQVAYERHTMNSLPDYDQTHQKEQVASRVEDALGRLRRTDREIVVLKYMSGLTIHEIAEVFEIGLSAAKMRLCRALEEFKGAYLRAGRDAPVPLRREE